MRVITGKAKGKRLSALDDLTVRPTPDRVKEAIFSMIQFDIEGCVFLDLFAGSGQMGIEALSRGAKTAVFVDENPRAQKLIKENLAFTGLSSGSRVVSMDSFVFLKHAKDKFDIAFLDPPYGKGLINSALEILPDIMSDDGIIICEHEIKAELPEKTGEFLKAKECKYGKTGVTVYRKGAEVK